MPNNDPTHMMLDFMLYIYNNGCASLERNDEVDLPMRQVMSHAVEQGLLAITDRSDYELTRLGLVVFVAYNEYSSLEYEDMKKLFNEPYFRKYYPNWRSVDYDTWHETLFCAIYGRV